MKIAVFLKHDNRAILDNDVVKVFIFNVDNEFVTNTGNEILLMRNINYLMLWAIEKHVQIIYTNEIGPECKRVLSNIGVEIKSMNNLKEHPLIESFLS